MPRERQVSFAAGELAPSLYGRTDIAAYPNGARTLFNFIVTPHGAASNRSGFRSQTILGSTARLVPFVFALDDVRLLEFNTQGYVNVWSLTTAGGLTYVTTVATVYNTQEIVDSLRFAQLGNIITIVSEHVGPYEFRRTASSPDSWEFQAVTFDVPTYYSNYGEPALLLHNGSFDLFGTPVPLTANDFEGDATHPAQPWVYAITRVVRDDFGREYETEPRVVTRVWDSSASNYVGSPYYFPIAVYSDWTQTLVWGDYASGGHWEGAFTDDDWIGVYPRTGVIVSTRIYRGIGNYSGGVAGGDVLQGNFGYVGETTGNSYTDDGRWPDFSDPPPSGFNPFAVLDHNGDVTRTEDPVVVAYFENRLVMGATSERPSTLFASAFDDFTNHDKVLTPDDLDAVSLSLLSQRLERIVALVPRKQLIALTTSGAWRISGVDGSPLTPTSIAAAPLTRDGAGELAPVEAGDSIFYVGTSGSVPRTLAFGDEATGPQLVETALLSTHLFEGYTVADWAYAEHPHKILWVVRSDGKLLSMTYVPGQNIAAWAEHEITDGTAESICVLPDGDEDAVFVVVVRSVGGSDLRYIERLAPRLIDDVRDGCFLDGAVTYNGVNTSLGDPDEFGIAMVTDGLSTGGDIGETVHVVLSETADGGLVGDVIRLDDPDSGMPLLLHLDSYDGGLGRYVATVLNTPVPSGLWDVEQDTWWVCVQSVSGLSHLEGQTVTALIDGNVRDDLVVSAGSVTWGSTDDDWAGVVHVGLPYNADLETLDAVNERDRQKLTSEVILELEATRCGQVGPSLDGLKDIRVREVSDSFGAMALKRQEKRIVIPDSWATSGRVAYRQNAPLPVTILGLTRVFSYGG